MTPRRAILAVLVAVTAVVGPASTSLAGTYDVVACDAAPSAANNSWVAVNTLPGGVAAFSACPSGGDPNRGLVARNAIGSSGSLVDQGTVAQWLFRAPPGTAIAGLTAGYRFYHASSGWEAALSDGSHIIRGCATGAGACDVSSPGEFIPLAGLSQIYFDVYCGAGPCPVSSTGDPAHSGLQATANMYSVAVRLEDDSPPTVTAPGGTLWAGAWLDGVAGYAFESSDNAGVAATNVLVDGTAIASTQQPCDYTNSIPCQSGQFSGTVDTQSIRPDGAHTVTLQAVDPAGNVGQVSRTVLVDNTPPGPPESLAVQGGDGWRSTNAFDVSWTNPSQAGVAPIDAAIARLCPTGDPNASTCSQQTVAGDGISELTNLSVPYAGSWDLSVWLRDAAGNASQANAGDVVQLRFDDTAPSSASFAPPDPSDPTRVEVDATDDASGIAGGAIEYRKVTSETWHPLQAQLSGSSLVAHIDDEDLAKGTYQLQATVTDAAGNERSTDTLANGAPAMLTLPLRLPTALVVGRAVGVHRGVLLRRRLHVRLSHRVRLEGRLTNGSGVAFANTAVLVLQRVHESGATWTPVGQVETSKTGRFSFLDPPGVSRTLRFRYAGTATILAVNSDVTIEVDARTTFASTKHLVVNGQTIRLHGHLLGGHYPAGGKLIALQVYLRGAWHTFATTRSHPHGRWHYDYRFDGTVGIQRYRFRALVPHEATYPFATGASNQAKVIVRGMRL